MNFNDNLEISQQRIVVLEEFSEFIKSLEKISEINNDILSGVFLYGYKGNITVTSTTNGVENLKSLNVVIQKQTSNIIIEVKKINAFKVGGLLSRLNNSGDIIELFNQEVGELCTEIFNLHQLDELSVEFAEILSKIIERIPKVLNVYYSLIHINSNLEEINLKITNGKNPKEDDILVIRALSENHEVEDALKILGLFKDVYDDLANLANLDQKDLEPLKYERLESGTLLTWFSGNPELIELCGTILIIGYTAYHCHFSKRARLEKERMKFDLLKDKLNLKEKLQMIGKEYQDNENTKQLEGKIVKSIEKIIESTPDMQINETVFEIDSNKKLLNERKLIE